MSAGRRVILLGTPMLGETLPRALEMLGARGPCALITAGWQEHEGPSPELTQCITQPVVDLAVYARARSALEADERIAEIERADPPVHLPREREAAIRAAFPIRLPE